MSGFHRSLGLWDATMLVAGSMIGSGIFIVSAGMMRDLGSPAWLLVAWVVAGVLTVLAALSYGELASMMPKAGGQFVYLERAYGRLTAFLYGWTAFTVITSGIIAAVAVAFAKFSAVFFPVLSPDNVLLDLGFMRVSAAQVYAVSAILLLTWFNTRGVESSKTFTTVFTTAKIAALLALIVVGLAVGLGTDVLASNFTDGWRAATEAADGTLTPLTGAALLSALGVAMVGSLFSSDGWNSITFIAGEVKEPQQNIPRSLALGTFIVTLLYVLANITYLSLLPSEGVMHAEADRVGTAAAEVIMGSAAVSVMAVLIMVSTFGCINSYVLTGPRMYYAMSREGLFFKQAGTLSAKGVPQWALWVQCAWSCVLCFSGTYGDLLDYATFASLLFYIVTIAGIFILRNREPEAPRPYKAFGYPLVPALYIVCALGFCLNLLVFKPAFTLGSLVIVGLGALVYLVTMRTRPSA
ncbi:MAG TPA: amino acid permease [Flavobacteriales bacterium]|nr:amino acid permease [Flavobacteriales bacterium]